MSFTPDNTIVLAISDDWQGVYVDGMLAVEAPRVRARVFAQIIMNYPFKQVFEKMIDDEWFSEVDLLPERIEDVHWEGEEWENGSRLLESVYLPAPGFEGNPPRPVYEGE